MFTKDNATDINTNNAEPRWIKDGENAVEYITNRPTYDVNLKHSFIDANEFNYRAKIFSEKMAYSGFIDEIIVADLLDFSINNTIKIKKDFAFNYKGIECFVTAGDDIALSKPLELVADIDIDMVTRLDNLDSAHLAGRYLLLQQNDTSLHSGKLYSIMRDIQIGDLLENLVVSSDIVEVPEDTYQDLVMLKVNDINITQGDGLVYLNGDKHTTPIIYADMTDAERVAFYTSNNNIRVEQDEIIQTQYEFVVETRFASGTDFIIGSGYVQDTVDKGIVVKQSENYIPLFQVERRNNALYDVNFNFKGSKQSQSGEWYQRSGSEIPKDAWGLWAGTVTGFVNINQPVGFYDVSNLVQDANIIDDRDITDFRMYAPIIDDTNAYLYKKIEDNNLRGYGANKDCTIYDVTVAGFNPISDGHEYYLGAPSYSINITGGLELFDIPGKLQGKERAYLTDDNGNSFEIYSIVNTGSFNKVYTIPTTANEVPSFTLPPKIYNFIVLTDSIRPANNTLFVNEIFGDNNLFPTGSNLSKNCSIELTPDNSAYLVTNNSTYDVVLNNDISYIEYNNVYRSFRATDTTDNTTNFLDGTYRNVNNETIIVPGGGFLIYVAATNDVKKPLHNWYEDKLTIEVNNFNRKFNISHKVEGHKQFIYLNYTYSDSIKVIKSNDYGFTWIEVPVVVELDKNGFILDTEIGYIYDIMYNGILDYKQGYTNIEDRVMLSYSNPIMMNTKVYSNMFMSALQKFPQVSDVDVEYSQLKIKKDHNSLNYLKHSETDTNDFDYRSPVLKTLGSVYKSGGKILASVDYEESGYYMFDKEIPNPGQQGNWFGYAIAEARDIKRLVISAPNGAATTLGIGTGLVYVFDWNVTTKVWDLLATISNPQGSNDYAKFGFSISITPDGTIITIGQGSTFTPNFSSILTYEWDNTTGEYIQWAEVLDKDSTSQNSGNYVFSNADGSIDPWYGIGQTVKLIDNNTLLVGLPGWNNDDNGTIIPNVGRIVKLTQSSGQWREDLALNNLTTYINGTTADIFFGNHLEYNGLLYVGSINAEIVAIDLVDNSIQDITGLTKLDSNPANTDTIIDYDTFAINKTGEYFIYSKNRDIHIKQFQNKTNEYTIFALYTRNEDIIPAEMVNANSLYINDLDVITIGYYGNEPILPNSYSVTGGETKVVYYQPNMLDTDLYDYFNNNNLSEEFTFIRETDKFTLGIQDNQNRLTKTGSIQLDLRHFAI